MDGAMIYECGWARLFVSLTPGIIVMLIGLFAKKYLIQAKSRMQLFFSIALVICVVQLSLLLAVGAYRNWSVMRRYHAGDYLTVEGEVTDLEMKPYAGKVQQGFQVDGVLFYYNIMFPGDPIAPGYQKPLIESKNMIHNGQSLRVSYIPYNDKLGNVIVRIEAIE